MVERKIYILLSTILSISVIVVYKVVLYKDTGFI